MAGLRGALSAIAAERDQWSGIPMPITGMNLVIEPSYPNAAALAAIGRAEGDAVPEGVTIRNAFWSTQLRSTVIVFEQEGKVRCTIEPGVHHFKYDLQTLGASDAWGIEQESAAMQLLGELIRRRQMKQYLLTGMFLERSPRSGLTYIFRRLKPTVVIDAREGGRNDCRIVCALCMHPIGFYSGSWAGAMTPTDDVVAHLMMMRADEPMLWRRANQHPPHRPEAGL